VRDTIWDCVGLCVCCVCLCWLLLCEVLRYGRREIFMFLVFWCFVCLGFGLSASLQQNINKLTFSFFDPHR